MFFREFVRVSVQNRLWPCAFCAVAWASGTGCSGEEKADDNPSTLGGSSFGGAGATGASGTPSSGSPATGGSNPGMGGAQSTGGLPSSGGGTGGGATGGAATGGVATAAGAGGTSGSAVAGGVANGGAAGGVASAGAAGKDGGVQPVISKGVRWVGRVDVANPSGERFAWSGTGFIGKVSGDMVSVKLKSDGGSEPIYFQPVIDGAPKARVSVASGDGEKTVVLGTGLGAGEHRVELYRETEGKPGFAYSTFLGFVSGEPQEPPPYSGRLLEVVGDSISAGYGNLGAEQHPNAGNDPSGGCRFETKTESAYLTYGAVAARALDADASIIAASGWGVYSDNSGSRSNVLKAVYGNILGGQATPPWDFRAVPQAVVINLGTNDFSADDALGQQPFSAAYNELLATIRGKYPNALVLCAIGPLLYGTGLKNATDYIGAIVSEANNKGDTKVKVLDFKQQDATKGTGCDWHPNVAENQRMADMLVKELRASLGW